MSIFNENDRKVKKLKKLASKIEALEEEYKAKSSEELADMTRQFRERLNAGETLDDLLVEAYATVREASARVLHMRPFPVQIMGAIALHQGRIAEMATGEGKTLVATMPAYLNALTSNGVHVVTVNEYLAQRDAEWMGRLYRFLGLTVGVIVPEMTADQKRESYNADITYCTNSELGFDFLRDNMAERVEDVMQRGLNYAIIDEVDSILIDEARTPLIISSVPQVNQEDYIKVARFVNELKPVLSEEDRALSGAEEEDDEAEETEDGDEQVKAEGDCEIDYEKQAVILTESGIRKAEQFFGVEDLFDNEGDQEKAQLYNRIVVALRARFLFIRDRHYLLSPDKQVVIIDQHTGRATPGRRFSDGLHQAIEAKEALLDMRVRVRGDNQIVATITYQNLFRQYRRISGMTGTAKTEEAEFKDIYKLDVVQIPQNKPCVRKDLPDNIYIDQSSKYRALVNDIMARHSKGQPILLGTTSVEESETISKLLAEQKIEHKVLNAKNNREEANIIAQAGAYGAVTISTNMAGRGTDILLGGNPEILARMEVADALKKRYNAQLFGGFDNYEKRLREERKHKKIVIAEKDKQNEARDESRRELQQRYDVLASIVLNGAADNVRVKYSREQVSAINYFRNAYGIDAEQLIEEYRPLYLEELEKFKIESEERKKKVIGVGGLCVIGTARNSSRRIDNQLRGRAGRQGDVGESVFYIALDDELLAFNNRERLISILNRLKMTLPDGGKDIALNYGIVRNLIINTQRKIEGRQFVQRRELLFYDEVLEVQRRTIYDERNLVLKGEQDVHSHIEKMIRVLAEDIVDRHIDFSQPYAKWDIEGLVKELTRRMLKGGAESEFAYDAENARAMAKELLDGEDIEDEDDLPEPVFRQGSVITKELCESGDYDDIVSAVIEKANEEYAEKVAYYAQRNFDYGDEERHVLLKIIDERWPEFLDKINALKEGVGLRAYGQHDPHAVYKKESMEMFDELIDNIYMSTAERLLKSMIPTKYIDNSRKNAETRMRRLEKDLASMLGDKDWTPDEESELKFENLDDLLASIVKDVAVDIVDGATEKTESGDKFNLKKIDSDCDRRLFVGVGNDMLQTKMLEEMKKDAPAPEKLLAKDAIVGMLVDKATEQLRAELIKLERKAGQDFAEMAFKALQTLLLNCWSRYNVFIIRQSRALKLDEKNVDEFLDKCETYFETFYKFWSETVIVNLCNGIDFYLRVGSGKQANGTEQVRRSRGIGRNDPCPCGSGKKYKNCCGKNA